MNNVGMKSILGDMVGLSVNWGKLASYARLFCGLGEHSIEVKLVQFISIDMRFFSEI